MHVPDTAQLPTMAVEVWDGSVKRGSLPDKVDLSDWFPPAGNQGRQYSCVSWALCYGIMSYRHNRHAGRTYPRVGLPDSAHTYSPAYLYNFSVGTDRLIKAPPDPKACLGGTNMANMVMYTMLGGACLLKDMPYDTTLVSCCDRPDYKLIMKALFGTHMPAAVEVGHYAPDQWRYHLANGRPILMGIVADTVLRDGGRAAAGSRPFTWTFHDSRNLFGHAVVCVGYDNADSTFLFMNSWGQKWGHHGLFKADLEVLYWKCSGGYVFPNEMLAKMPANPGRPADEDTLHGPVVREDLDKGEYQQINGHKVKLADLGDKDRTAVMQVFNAHTDTLMHTLNMEAGRTYSLYQPDQRVQLRYEPRSGLGRLLGNSVDLEMRTGPAHDAYLRERNAQLTRLKEGLPRND